VVGSLKAVYTLGWYLFSAAVFGEVYIWSQTKDAGLGWVDYGREDRGIYWERAVVNENAVFLRSLWLLLAVGGTVVHFWRGVDGLKFEEKRNGAAGRMTTATATTAREPPSGATSKMPKILQDLVAEGPVMLRQALQLLIPTLALTFPIYLALLRRLLWPYIHGTARIMLTSQLPQTSEPTGLQNHLTLSWQAVSSSIILILMWETTNTVFTLLMSRPPLRNGEPLTSEVRDLRGSSLGRNRDPNGSLLSGLRSKRDVVRAFAFSELALICSSFEARRRTVYLEVDRAGGRTWEQISNLCLTEITGIQSRSLAARTPAPAQQQQHISTSSQPQQQQRSLPKISDRAVIQTGDLFPHPTNATVTHRMATISKSMGQSPQGGSLVQTRAKQAASWTSQRAESEYSTHLSGRLNTLFFEFLRSPIGEPFRRTFARKIKGVLFGPTASKQTICDASRALSSLCAHSIKEDDYGSVARSIPEIVRTYTSAINSLTSFVAAEQADWTDVEFDAKTGRRVADVDEVLDRLREGLEGVLLAFGEYADSIGLTKKEVREAREAVGRGGPEMREQR